MRASITPAVWTRTVERGAALLLLPVLAAYAKRRGLVPSLDRLILARNAPVPRHQLSSLPHLLAAAGEMEPHPCQRRRLRCRLLTEPLVAELANHWQRQQQLRRAAQQQLVAAQHQLAAASRQRAPGAGGVLAAGASTQLAARGGGHLALAAAAAELAATAAASSAGQRSSLSSAADRHLASSTSSGVLEGREPTLA